MYGGVWETMETCICMGGVWETMDTCIWMGGVWERMDTCICMSPFVVLLKLLQQCLLIGLTPTENNNLKNVNFYYHHF